MYLAKKWPEMVVKWTFMSIKKSYKIEKTGNESTDRKNVTIKINKIVESMIIKNPTQWIWSHNRWK